MENMNTLLITVSYLVEISDDVLYLEYGPLDKLNMNIEETIRSSNSDFNLQWQSTQTRVLDPATMNCGKCDNCGCWTTNREEDNWIPSLTIGAVVDGKLYCDSCLPKDHPLAF